MVLPGLPRDKGWEVNVTVVAWFSTEPNAGDFDPNVIRADVCNSCAASSIADHTDNAN